jgi:hypothetical protein
LVNLTRLDCYGCPNLTSIPNELVNLTRLICYRCRNLTSISNELVNLTSINCAGCPNITSIPKELVNLTSINCAGCPKLTSIPKELVNLIFLNCSGCPWLDVKENEYYKENIRYLVRCQGIFKRQILARRLLKLTPKLVPLWWHPGCKGGFFHKKSLGDFMNELEL